MFYLVIPDFQTELATHLPPSPHTPKTLFHVHKLPAYSPQALYLCQWDTSQQQELEQWYQEQCLVRQLPLLMLVNSPPHWKDLSIFSPCDYVVASQTGLEFWPRAEQLLQQNPPEQAFLNIFDRHAAMMLLIDAHKGHILNANQAALDFYGYSESEMLEKSIFDLNQADYKTCCDGLNPVE